MRLSFRPTGQPDFFYDRLDDAFALLYSVGIQPGKRPIYRTFLAKLRDSRPLDHHSFAKLLSAIDAAEIPLDTNLLNVLISREVRLKRTVNAVSMFDEMKKNPDFLPNSYTSVFHVSQDKTSLYEALFPCRITGNIYIPSSRTLSRTYTLLNTALKAFTR